MAWAPGSLLRNALRFWGHVAIPPSAFALRATADKSAGFPAFAKASAGRRNMSPPSRQLLICLRVRAMLRRGAAGPYGVAGMSRLLKNTSRRWLAACSPS